MTDALAQAIADLARQARPFVHAQRAGAIAPLLTRLVDVMQLVIRDEAAMSQTSGMFPALSDNVKKKPTKKKKAR